MLRQGAFVDVAILGKGSWVEAVSLPGLGHELLDGMAFRSSPTFENWLENERRHVAGTTAAVLHEAALTLLARGDAQGARDHAAHLVRLNPFDENAHVLLVRCLRAGGESDAAVRQVEACTQLFRLELGVDPSPALRSAADDPVASVGVRVTGPAAVDVLIEAGAAAVAAGAPEAGIARLRGAVSLARRHDDPELLAWSLISLGRALVHSARGRDEEGAAALHEGSALAEEVGDRRLAATGWRETGWIQFLRGRYDRAEATLARAAELADGDEEELAWIEVILGSCRSDVGDYATAAELLRSSIARSQAIRRADAEVFGRSMLGKLHLLRGEIAQATALLDESLDLVEAHGLTSFRPWPESLESRDRPSPGRRRRGRTGLRACVRTGLRGRRPLLGEHRRPRTRARGRRARRGRAGSRAARRGAAALPPPARHLPLDRGLRPRRPLRRGGRARPRSRRPLDRRARGDRRAPRPPRAAWRAQRSTAPASASPARARTPARSRHSWTTRRSTSSSTRSRRAGEASVQSSHDRDGVRDPARARVLRDEDRRRARS